MVEVREFQLADTEPVQGLLAAIWQDKTSYVSRLSNRNRSAFVALEGSQIRGFSSLFTNPNHPERDYIGIHVLPEFRERGLGTRLLEALKPHFQTGRKIQTITVFSEAKRFLETHGFLELMRTHEPTLQVQKTNMLEVNLPPGCVLKTLNDTGFKLLEIARLHAQIYSEQHTWNATASMNDQDALENFMEDLIPEALFVIVFEHQPIAVSSLRGQGSTMELMWFGVLNRYAQHRKVLTWALLNAALEYALANGVEQLQAELDSLIPEAVIALESLPFEPCEPWITMISSIDLS